MAEHSQAWPETKADQQLLNQVRGVSWGFWKGAAEGQSSVIESQAVPVTC